MKNHRQAIWSLLRVKIGEFLVIRPLTPEILCMTRNRDKTRIRAVNMRQITFLHSKPNATAILRSAAQI